MGTNEHGPLAGLAPVALPQKRPLEAGVPKVVASLVLRSGTKFGHQMLSVCPTMLNDDAH